jgi:hypothetical protein
MTAQYLQSLHHVWLRKPQRAQDSNRQPEQHPAKPVHSRSQPNSTTTNSKPSHARRTTTMFFSQVLGSNTVTTLSNTTLLCRVTKMHALLYYAYSFKVACLSLDKDTPPTAWSIPCNRLLGCCWPLGTSCQGQPVQGLVLTKAYGCRPVGAIGAAQRATSQPAAADVGPVPEHVVVCLHQALEVCWVCRVGGAGVKPYGCRSCDLDARAIGCASVGGPGNPPPVVCIQEGVDGIGNCASPGGNLV